MFKTNTVTSYLKLEGWVPMGMENQDKMRV